MQSIAEMPDQHQVPIDELLRRLGSSPNGLSNAEAERRLSRSGLNVLQVRTQVSELRRFLRQFNNLFAALLVVGAALALVALQFQPGGDNLYIAAGLLAVVILNAIFTYLQERQGEKIMESFQSMLPATIIALRDGAAQCIDTRRLVPGDVSG